MSTHNNIDFIKLEQANIVELIDMSRNFSNGDLFIFHGKELKLQYRGVSVVIISNKHSKKQTVFKSDYSGIWYVDSVENTI